MPDSDHKLVELSLKEAKHFTQIVEKYESKLLRYIFRLARMDQQCAEDVLQEVFIKVYENLNDFDDSFSFSSWIYRITHNEVINYIRKNKHRPVGMDSNGDDNENLIEIIADETNISEELRKKESAKSIRTQLYLLPIKYRDVLVLRFLEDKSYQEISDILKKSVNNVSVLINRAKEKLKQKIIDLNI